MPSIYNHLDREMFRGRIEALKSFKEGFYFQITNLTEEINEHYEMMKKPGISKEEKTRIYQMIQELKDRRTSVHQEIRRINYDLDGLYLALRM